MLVTGYWFQVSGVRKGQKAHGPRQKVKARIQKENIE